MAREEGEVRPYVIRQGDHLTQLAHRLGFDAAEVWDHPKNRGLKERRTTGNILHPGDILYVPEPAPRGLDLHTGANRYRATIPSVEIRIALRDAEGAALAGKAFTVHGVGAPRTGTTDGDGVARFSVRAHQREVELVLDETGRRYTIAIGAMDPVEELSGVQKRLTHLGHLQEIHGGPASASALHAAIAAFQEAQGLAVSGELDDATREALVAAHGS